MATGGVGKDVRVLTDGFAAACVAFPDIGPLGIAGVPTGAGPCCDPFAVSGGALCVVGSAGLAEAVGAPCVSAAAAGAAATKTATSTVPTRADARIVTSATPSLRSLRIVPDRLGEGHAAVRQFVVRPNDLQAAVVHSTPHELAPDHHVVDHLLDVGQD